MKIRRLLLTFGAAASMALAVPGAALASSHATGVVRVESNGHVQDHVVSAALARKINSGQWQDLSTKQLASAGIHAGMNSGQAGIMAEVRPATKMHPDSPDSASGCNVSTYDSMCIYVVGSGLKVNDWDTSVSNYFGLDRCTYAGYWVAGVLYRTSNEVCGDGDFWAYWAPNQYFINGTKLCNTWVNWAGKPCETVKS